MASIVFAGSMMSGCSHYQTSAGESETPYSEVQTGSENHSAPVDIDERVTENAADSTQSYSDSDDLTLEELACILLPKTGEEYYRMLGRDETESKKYAKEYSDRLEDIRSVAVYSAHSSKENLIEAINHYPVLSEEQERLFSERYAVLAEQYLPADGSDIFSRAKRAMMYIACYENAVGGKEPVLCALCMPVAEAEARYGGEWNILNVKDSDTVDIEQFPNDMCWGLIDAKVLVNDWLSASITEAFYPGPVYTEPYGITERKAEYEIATCIGADQPYLRTNLKSLYLTYQSGLCIVNENGSWYLMNDAIAE